MGSVLRKDVCEQQNTHTQEKWRTCPSFSGDTLANMNTLRIRTLKNKGFEGPQTLVIEGSTPSKQGPRILRADEQFG